MAYRSGDWKIVRQVPRGQTDAPFELFNLAEDPNETTDLAKSKSDVVARLRAKLDTMNSQMVPPRWGAAI